MNMRWIDDVRLDLVGEETENDEECRFRFN